jgi:aminoglycoside 3-N-acetyltransferase
MVSYRDFIKVFKEVGLSSESQILIHASLSNLGEVSGGSETVVGAIIATVHAVVTPTFTSKAMIIPPFGPEENAINYDTSGDEGVIGEVFHQDMPTDQRLGEFAEIIRCHPKAYRSGHPLLSFSGVNAESLLSSQSLEKPWAPIKNLADADGDVVLLGVDHTANISLHYAEALAGRRQFLRWAMWEGKVVEVPHWPGCSKGFEGIASKITDVVRQMPIGESTLKAIPLRDLINIASGWIREDPEALLCHDPKCEYCQTIRASNRVASNP